MDASVTLGNDEQLAQQLLKQFGQKYPLGWIVYVGRFRQSLANGPEFCCATAWLTDR